MAYEPINWQTGDTITAEKLNKMDPGWGMQGTQLFSETVTTADDGMGNNFGAFTYTSLISADTITVTFDGVGYTCPRIDAFEQHYYGGFTGEEFDYSDYPFAIISDGSEGNFISTENAGTYTVVADMQGVEVSENFSSAVNACVGSGVPMRCIPEVTTYDEMLFAKESGRLLYFYAGNTMHIITYFLEAESETAVNAIPEGVANVETYGFMDVDGVLVFNRFVY